MISYHDGLRNLLKEKLKNDYGIIFDVALYNSDEINYYKDVDDSDGYGVSRQRVVPTTIPSIIGDYINIPNISVTDNTISLEFDLFIGDYKDLEYLEQNEYKSVSYENTINAIEDMRRELLAQYHPLGYKQLRFGGEDSNALVNFTTSFDYNFLFLKGVIEDGNETILTAGGLDFLTKDNDNIYFTNGTDILSVPYISGKDNQIIAYNDSGWTLENITTGDTDSGANTNSITMSQLAIGSVTGFTGIIDTIALDTTKHDLYDSNGDYGIHFYEFESKDTLSNNGTVTLASTNEINNCILWGSKGNAIFSFETLVASGDVRWIDDGKPYQIHTLTINTLVSDDVLFGNNFEYYLIDGANEFQIYPIDRSHTYAGVANTIQKINGRYGTAVIESNNKELTHTFFYNGERNLTKLLKQVTINDQEQNKIYELRVQYPFFSETYDVLIDSGGTSPNINNLSTFSITYKQKDENLT